MVLIYIFFYSPLNGWSCFITHTIMRRIFPFIHRNKHYTALTRLKHTQRGEMDATDHTRMLLEDGFLEQHWWKCWAFLQLSFCQNTFNLHRIKCHYGISYEAPFWNGVCVLTLSTRMKHSTLFFWSSVGRVGFYELHLQYVLCIRSNSEKYTPDYSNGGIMLNIQRGKSWTEKKIH